MTAALQPLSRFRILVVALAAFAVSACGINSVPTAEENAKAKWADVQAAFQERANLIPNLAEVAKSAAEQERSILTDVIEARAKATSIQVNANDLNDPAKMKQFAAAQEQLGAGLGRLLANFERYPELKSITNYQMLQSQLEGQENRIRVAIRDYNEAVRDYNTRVRTFPEMMGAQEFPALDGRVTDAAGIIPADVETRLTEKLEALETGSHRQLVIATVPDLQGYDIADYGYRLGREWGIGDKERNDGALLIVAPNERKVRIEVGYGLEGTLTDGLSFLIINEEIVPRFKAGDMPGGIEAGTDAIITQLTLPPEEARRVAEMADKIPEISWWPRIFFMMFIFFFFILPILRAIFGRKGGRRFKGSRSSPIVWLPSGGSSWGSSSGGGFSGGFSGGGGSFGGGGASGGW